MPNKKVDAIITSPPFSEMLQAETDYEKRKERLTRKGFTKKTHGLLRGQKQTSSVIGGDTRYSPNPKNIGNLKHGQVANVLTSPRQQVDVVLTSPPFGSTSVAKTFKSEKELEEFARKQWVFQHGRSLQATKRFIKKSWQGYPKNRKNISNLPHKPIDVVITSPPFGNGLSNKNLNWERQIERMRKAGVSEERIRTFLGEANLLRDHMGAYSKDPKNIGNLPLGQPVDAVLTSPPFARTKGGLTGERNLIAKIRDGKKPQRNFGGIQTIPRPCSDNPQNIENLNYEKVDTVLTSPPYAESMQERGGTQHKFEQEKKIGVHYSHSKNNIGNLKATKGVDAVLTSPPYGHEATASKPTKLEEQGLFKMGHSKETPLTDQDHRTWALRSKGNIAKRKLFVRVPCSPQEATHHDTRPGRKGIEWEWTKEVKLDMSNMGIQKKKSTNKGKTETYLEAMLKCYRGMYEVLKPGGTAIVVLKNFIRHWQVVDLIGDTERLCEYVGFQLVKRIKFELPHISFWRLNFKKQYEKKFGKPIPMDQDWESVYKYETVLVFKKIGDKKHAIGAS